MTLTFSELLCYPEFKAPGYLLQPLYTFIPWGRGWNEGQRPHIYITREYVDQLQPSKIMPSYTWSAAKNTTTKLSFTSTRAVKPTKYYSKIRL